jgi:hypothetical protein
MHFTNPGTPSLRAQVLDEFRAHRTPWGCVATVPDEPPELEEPPPARIERRRRIVISC